MTKSQRSRASARITSWGKRLLEPRMRLGVAEAHEGQDGDRRRPLGVRPLPVRRFRLGAGGDGGRDRPPSPARGSGSRGRGRSR